jgi:hypothetical protein
MRNGPLVQASLTFPAIQKYPHKLKGLGLYIFLGSIMEAQLPTNIWPLFGVKSPSIWPKNLQKGPILGQNYNKKNPLQFKKSTLAPLG